MTPARYSAPVEPLPPLSVDVVDALKAAGLTQSDVARLYGVTRAAVSAVVRRHGGAQTPRQIARGIAWPWNVPRKFGGQRVYRLLRDHLAWVAESTLLTGNLPESREGDPKLLMGNLLAGNLGKPNLCYSPVTYSQVGLLTGNIGPGTPVRGTAGTAVPGTAGTASTAGTAGTASLSWRQLRDLRSFYARMKDLVIEFDPSLPPSEGVSVGGFAYRERVPADSDLLIRVNAHTTLTEAG